jgi:hypothetical protein
MARTLPFNAQVGADVVYRGDHGNLVRGLVAEVSQGVLVKDALYYRVVGFWSEASDLEAGRWVYYDRIVQEE